MTGSALFSTAPLWSFLVVLVFMAIEWRVSARHEWQLRERGAYEPPGDVYRTMRWAYPAAFTVMTIEGMATGGSSVSAVAAGLCLFVVAKALKTWAIWSLGDRWTFRVLVPPGEPLVTAGPYAWMRHPNYVAVLGELVSMVLLTGAWLSGPAATLLFGLLIRKRIRIEDGLLRHHTC